MAHARRPWARPGSSGAGSGPHHLIFVRVGTFESCDDGSALPYWWSVAGARARNPTGTSTASLFTTMLHTSALGALLTFAPSPWYATDRARAFGLTSLEDQQLGGLIMWVPGGGFCLKIA